MTLLQTNRGEVGAVRSDPAAIAQLNAQCGIPYSLDSKALQDLSQDFGHITRGNPQAVVQPRHVTDLVAMVREANRIGLSITPRGRGRSQSGQAVSQSGIALDTCNLNTVDSIHLQPNLIRCGAGATWRQLISHCYPQTRLPYVMPLNLDLSIGGTLSAGGFGATSHRFGPAIAHVDSLEVVTGSGEHISCSPQLKPDVFEAALGGLGRCVVIASATLRLRPVKPNVRTYYLLYDDIHKWLADQKHLAQTEQIDYLEGFCSSSIQGLRKTAHGRRPFMHWQYGLHVGIEFDTSQAPQTHPVLEGLQQQQVLLVEEDSTLEFAARYDARFQAMRQSGAWQQAHPWFECLLPFEAAHEFIPQALESLPHYFGDGHRVMMLADTASSQLFMRPPAAAIAFAVLPTGLSEATLPAALEVLADLDEQVSRCGGKRYLSGWLGTMTRASWQKHFGPQYHNWCSIKQALDPNNVLQSALFS